jgi:plastocyanin
MLLFDAMNPRTFAAAFLAAIPLAGAAATVSVEVRDGAGAAVSDAAVYAMPRSGAAPSRPRRDTEIEQVARQFSPAMTVVQRGSSIGFPNRDTVRHHVYSFSPAKSFEIKLYVGTPAAPVVFDKAGDVVLGCNIHDHMRAYVYVVDTPWFAKTDAEGRARLDSLPAGEFELLVWHSSQASAAAPQLLKLRADEAGAAKFALPMRARPARPAAK